MPAANVLAWPMAGAADLLHVPPAVALLRVASITACRRARRLWRLSFTFVGLRYLVQQAYANSHPRELPAGVVKKGTRRYDFRSEVAAERDMPAGGLAGLLSPVE